MSRFEVQFSLQGSMTVECDDQADARNYVESVGVGQILSWALRGSDITINDNLAVTEVKVPESFGKAARKFAPGKCAR